MCLSVTFDYRDCGHSFTAETRHDPSCRVLPCRKKQDFRISWKGVCIRDLFGNHALESSLVRDMGFVEWEKIRLLLENFQRHTKKHGAGSPFHIPDNKIDVFTDGFPLSSLDVLDKILALLYVYLQHHWARPDLPQPTLAERMLLGQLQEVVQLKIVDFFTTGQHGNSILLKEFGRSEVYRKHLMQRRFTLIARGAHPDDPECVICAEKYGEPNEKGKSERAVRTTCCGQIIGQRCLQRNYLLRDKCPLCGGNMFQTEKDLPFSFLANVPSYAHGEAPQLLFGILPPQAPWWLRMLCGESIK